MNDAIRDIREGFVDAIRLALMLPVRIVSVTFSLLSAFVHHRGDFANTDDRDPNTAR